jgi:hypothetical protein
MAEVVVAVPQATPAPLGLFAFGMTTCALSAVNAGLLPVAGLPILLPMALAFGGLAQVIAGIVEFRNGETFGATAFTSYGFFWIWFALTQWTVGTGLIKVDAAAATPMAGTILLLWGVFTTLLWVATFRLSKLLCLLFALLAVTFFLLAAAHFGLQTGKPGGWLGLLTGVVAIILGFADLMNAMAKRIILPTGVPFIID